MPEIIIRYEKPETLKLLKVFAKYLNFIVLPTKRKMDLEKAVNDVTIIPADTTIDISEMEDVFSGKNVDAATLRQKAWQRK